MFVPEEDSQLSIFDFSTVFLEKQESITNFLHFLSSYHKCMKLLYSLGFRITYLDVIPT